MSLISCMDVRSCHTALFQQAQPVLDRALLSCNLADSLAVRLHLMGQLRYGGYDPVEELGVGRFRGILALRRRR